MAKSSTSWKKGESGNPEGRPKGSRDRIREGFLGELAEDFEQHGKDTITKVRENQPHIYFQVIAKLMPRENVNENIDIEPEATDEEYKERLESVLPELLSTLGASAVVTAALESFDGNTLKALIDGQTSGNIKTIKKAAGKEKAK